MSKLITLIYLYILLDTLGIGQRGYVGPKHGSLGAGKIKHWEVHLGFIDLCVYFLEIRQKMKL